MQRILIVEDDIEIQDMLRNYLTDAGYEVVLASDGVTGIAWCMRGYSSKIASTHYYAYGSCGRRKSDQRV